MRTGDTATFPLFRSSLQGRLLAVVFVEPAREHTITELAGRLGAHVASVHREVDRLERAGVLVTRRVGRTRVVRVDEGSRFEPELSSLTMKAFGPVPVLSHLLSTVDGVRAAYIFGSWAERLAGGQGPPPRDLDVLVVGEPDREEVYRVATEAERVLGMPVDAVIRSRRAFDSEQDPLIRQALTGPHLELDLDR